MFKPGLVDPISIQGHALLTRLLNLPQSEEPLQMWVDSWARLDSLVLDVIALAELTQFDLATA